MPKPISIILPFVALSLIGISLIPFLSFQLFPSRTLPALTITYNWPYASEKLIEERITAPLEGILATLPELEHVKSTTVKGTGRIYLEFEADTDLQMRQFECSALIRQVYPSFPSEVFFPEVEPQVTERARSTTLLSYTLNGYAHPYWLKNYAEKSLRIPLSQIQGIHQVNIFGASPFVWEMTYQPHELLQWGLQPEDIAQALNRLGSQVTLGRREGNQWILVSGNQDWQSLPITQYQGRILCLKDILTIRYAEQAPEAYYRLNGLNQVTIQMEADRFANQLKVASNTKALITQLESRLPGGFSLVKTYDATTFLQEELKKIAVRSGFTLGILLLFVVLISRSIHYGGIILLSLLGNLAIAGIVYYLLDLEMHLYSLAGLTVSMGLVIDNSVVMIEHLKSQGNTKIILALLTSTLTTLAALSVIFFLPSPLQLQFIDFAWVMIINLSVSMGIAYWFIPALLRQFPVSMSPQRSRIFRRRQAKGKKIYENYLQWAIRRRTVLFLLGIWGFGIPIFLLPDNWQETQGSRTAKNVEKDTLIPWYGEWYNSSVGSENYQEKIKPWLNKILGGSLRLFLEETFPRSGNRTPERTVLHIEGQMPQGTIVSQMNQAFLPLENFLSQFDEIDQFETKILSTQQASLKIFFKPEAERKGFHFFLKNQVEGYVSDLGAVDWRVFGVGQGFSNAVGMGLKNSRIQLKGFNYEDLMRFAESLKVNLLNYPRIDEVFFNGQIRWDYRPYSEYIMPLDRQRLALLGVNGQQILNRLRPFSQAPSYLPSLPSTEGYSPAILFVQSRDSLDVWELNNLPIQVDSLGTKLQQLGTLKKIPSGEVIYKEDQQYHVWVEYDLVGSDALREKVEREMAEETQRGLPIGYSAKPGWDDTWGQRQKMHAFPTVFWVIAMVFCICAILLESLRQPLAVIAIIPISFIGVFLTFYLFNLDFDQGGYASLLLLSGISVNAALYIINDFNHYTKKYVHLSLISIYLKAFTQKSIPIGLAISSTVLGLLPFLLGGPGEPFWFALAAGTTGGLIFSLFGILLFLPVFLIQRKNLH